VENVSALLVRGIGDVLRDLAALGYDAEWHCIPASYLSAPHRRDRVWILAHPHQQGLEGWNGAKISEWCATIGHARQVAWWTSEPAVGRVAHGVPGRVDRLKQLGNAVVPQIPELIGRAILAAEAA
jgi:DNA (cytosine-5)-methyltransferase 1